MPLQFVAQGPLLIPSGGDITTGLKGLWLFDEGSGTAFNDTSGAGHNGTLHSESGSTWNVGSRNFTGVGVDWGEVSNHADFSAGSAFTVFGWINSAGADSGAMWSKYDFGTNQRGWAAGCGTAANSAVTKLRFFASDDGSSGAGHLKDVYGSQTLFDSTFHSFAVRFNAGVVDLFVNGIKDTSTTEVGTTPITSVFNANCSFDFGNGILNNGVNTSFGTALTIKKYRYYNIAKSDADILAMHSA